MMECGRNRLTIVMSMTIGKIIRISWILTISILKQYTNNQPDATSQLTADDLTKTTSDPDTVRFPGFSQRFSLNDQLRPDISSDNNGDGISNDIVLYMQGSRGQYLRGAVF